MIDDSPNIPDEIKAIVKAICKAYVILTNGLIGLNHIKNVCNAKYVVDDANDEESSTYDNVLNMPETTYDKKCNISHVIHYVNDPEYMKLLTILTYELGHVITESNPCEILDNGNYPIIKKTNAVYLNCTYDENGALTTTDECGFRTSDGFIEHMGFMIFEDETFINELADNGILIGGCEYRDQRLFPSRIYDEFRICFELFDFLLNGELFTFSCTTYPSNREIIDFINRTNYFVISKYLDHSNDALWALKKYEGQPSSKEFEKDFLSYTNSKGAVLALADELYRQMPNKPQNDSKYKELRKAYEECIYTNTLLPFDNRGKAGAIRVKE